LRIGRENKALQAAVRRRFDSAQPLAELQPAPESRAVTPSRDIERAANALREGKLVAFPTETVYGLGADARNEAAVSRIFEVKRRPADHPLIVHLASAEELPRWAAHVPETARRLATAFWPGPLTLLLPKAAGVPDATTGGLNSVGLRVPAHPVALELLRRFGGGVAAPSANRFGRVSPTSAAHVQTDLGDDVDVLLDGGQCAVGVESTILDLTHDAPVLLRPGGVTVEQIEALLGVSVSRHSRSDVRAPGMLASHYAPRARVELVSAESLLSRAAELSLGGARVTVLLQSPVDRAALEVVSNVTVCELGLGDDVAAQQLYGALRQADLDRADVVLTSLPVARGLGEALADRLLKAAGPRSGS
jgi:L-threonylcarbamoyladenylate synthase